MRIVDINCFSMSWMDRFVNLLDFMALNLILLQVFDLNDNENYFIKILSKYFWIKLKTLMEYLNLVTLDVNAL